jgi:hypothetical protein
VPRSHQQLFVRFTIFRKTLAPVLTRSGISRPSSACRQIAATAAYNRRRHSSASGRPHDESRTTNSSPAIAGKVPILIVDDLEVVEVQQDERIVRVKPVWAGKVMEEA